MIDHPEGMYKYKCVINLKIKITTTPLKPVSFGPSKYITKVQKQHISYTQINILKRIEIIKQWNNTITRRLKKKEWENGYATLTGECSCTHLEYDGINKTKVE